MKEGEKMALSGSFSVSQRNEKEKATCVWSATQDIANNKTTITAYLDFFHKYQINIGNRTHKIVINGVEKEVTTSAIACAGADTHRSTSVTVEVPHNADGTKNVTIGFTFSVKATLSGTYYESMSTSTAVNLDTIPRASQPTLSASSTEMSKAVTINTNRASSSFTHTLTYAFGSATGTIAEGVGASYEWTIPLELANQIPNAVSGTGKIYCKTYNGSTLIGTKEVAFGATVPASVVPTRKSFSAVDTTGYMTTYGGLIQGKSKLKVDVEAEGAYGSTIKSYKILVGNTTYHGNSITADILGTSSISVSATFTDSRGRTNTVGLGTQLRVYAYTNPKISNVNVYRCNANGTADESGAYMRGVVQASASGFVPNNTCTLKIEYKKQTDTEWTLITSATIAAMAVMIPVTAADPNCIYDVRATATDNFTTTIYQVVIPTVYTLMDFKADGKGIAFGKVSTEEGFDVDMPTRFRQNVRSEGDVIANLGENNQLSLNQLKETTELTFGYTRKNLFDVSRTTVESNWYIKNNFYNLDIYVGVGNTVTASFKTDFGTGTNEYVQLYNGTTIATLHHSTSGNFRKVQITAGSDGYIQIRNGDWRGKVFTALCKELQIELGTEATTYERYAQDVNERIAELKSTLGYTKKNLLPKKSVTQSVGGLTFTPKDDGCISVSGATTGANNMYFKTGYFLTLPKGTYILSGMESVKGGTEMCLRVYDGTTIYASLYAGTKSVTFTLSKDTTVTVYVNWNTVGITYSGTIYPMIRRAEITDDTYEPYVDDVDTRLNEELICNGTVGGGAVSCDFSQYKKITCYYYHGGYVFECTIHTEMIADYEIRRFVSGYHKGYVQFNIHKTSIQIGGTRFDGVDNPNLNDPFYVFGHR